MKQLNTLLISLLVCVTAILIYDKYIQAPSVPIRSGVQEMDAEARLYPIDNKTIYQSSKVNLVKAASTATPAVVYVRSITDMSQDDWRTSYTSSSGSGVIVSVDGYIITSRHLIEHSTHIEVILNDRREYTAEIIGSDRNTDLALLKIEASDLPTIRIANSNNIQVGEWVLAIGNPLKLQSTVTAGIISAIARDVPFSVTDTEVNSFIQTDAVVNKGNSGGALVNESGHLIGINSAILSHSGSYEGYSFAIPSNLVLKVIEDLRTFGSVHRGELGIKGINVNSDLARAKNLPTISGIYVDELTRGGAAERAGIKVGDIIQKLNDLSLGTQAHLYQELATYRPGDKIELTIFRNKQLQKITVRLKNRLNTTDISPITPTKNLRNLGIEVRNLTTEEKDLIKKEGVKVISVVNDGKIARTKMDPGFIITKMNNELVSDIKQFEDLLTKMQGRIILEGIYERYEGEFWYVFNND